MYLISDEVIKFIENTMENWKVELKAGGKKFSWGENFKRYLQERCAITITIYNSNDATELPTLKVHRGIQTS